MPGAKRDAAEEPSRRSSRKRVKVDYKEPSDSVVLGMGAESAAASTATGSVKEYRDTLIRQKKELYKDPPSLPPPEPEVLTLPKQSKVMSKHEDGTLRCPDYPDSDPTLNPLRCCKWVRPASPVLQCPIHCQNIQLQSTSLHIEAMLVLQDPLVAHTSARLNLPLLE